jgi:hypothetical protein
MMKSGNRHVLFMTHPELGRNSEMSPLCGHMGRLFDNAYRNDYHDANGWAMSLPILYIAVEEQLRLIPS